MKKYIAILAVGALAVMACSKTAVPTEPENTPSYKVYFGQDAADHGFVAPTAAQAEAYLQYKYEENKAELQNKLRNEYEVTVTCNKIFNILKKLGVNIPDRIRDVRCAARLYAKRQEGGGLLDWDLVGIVLAGYGIGYQGYVGGVGGLSIGGSIMRDMDEISLDLYFQVDDVYDTFIYADNNSWGGRVAVAYGGVVFVNTRPTAHHIELTTDYIFRASDPNFQYSKALTIYVDVNP